MLCSQLLNSKPYIRVAPCPPPSHPHSLANTIPSPNTYLQTVQSFVKISRPFHVSKLPFSGQFSPTLSYSNHCQLKHFITKGIKFILNNCSLKSTVSRFLYSLLKPSLLFALNFDKEFEMEVRIHLFLFRLHFFRYFPS